MWEKEYYRMKEEHEKLNKKYEFLYKDKHEIDENHNKMRVDYETSKIEIMELIQQLDMKDIKIDELQRANVILDGNNAQKERMLKERRDINDKSYTNTMLDQMKRQYELEVENWKVRAELLENTLKSAEDKISDLEGDVRDGRGNLRVHAVHENKMNELKSQIVL